MNINVVTVGSVAALDGSCNEDWMSVESGSVVLVWTKNTLACVCSISFDGRRLLGSGSTTKCKISKASITRWPQMSWSPIQRNVF